MTLEMSIRLAGIVTLMGTVPYTAADILLLAHRIGPRQEIPITAVDFNASDRWQKRAEILTTMSKIPWRRLVWGGLLGVFATPLVILGAWLVCQALAPAGWWAAVPVAVLWLATYPVGAFIHGSPDRVDRAVADFEARYRPAHDNPRRVAIEIEVTRILGRA